MTKVDPRDFLLNTDYEMDKIIYVHSLDQTVSEPTTITIAHGLPITPLVFGLWSTYEDLTNSHEFGEMDDIYSPSLTCSIEATEEDVILQLTPTLGSGGYESTHFYIKIFGFEPKYAWSSETLLNTGYSSKKLSATSAKAKNFILNTDYNYLKLLVKTPETAWNDTGGYSYYKHNLGYVPQVLKWFGWTRPGGARIWPDGAFSYDAFQRDEYSYSYGTFVTDTEIRQYNGLVPGFSELRIYADEA